MTIDITRMRKAVETKLVTQSNVSALYACHKDGEITGYGASVKVMEVGGPRRTFSVLKLWYNGWREADAQDHADRFVEGMEIPVLNPKYTVSWHKDLDDFEPSEDQLIARKAFCARHGVAVRAGSRPILVINCSFEAPIDEYPYVTYDVETTDDEIENMFV